MDTSIVGISRCPATGLHGAGGSLQLVRARVKHSTPRTKMLQVFRLLGICCGGPVVCTSTDGKSIEIGRPHEAASINSAISYP